jgi:hypothetical protein
MPDPNDDPTDPTHTKPKPSQPCANEVPVTEASAEEQPDPDEPEE